MKTLILFLTLQVFLSSCKEDSNPVIIDPPNPFAQKEIDWPSLQKAPWPMYRHDPQLTGRSQYAGPTKGVIVDTLNFNPSIKFASGISIDINNNIYTSLENWFNTDKFWSYNLTSKKVNWKTTGYFVDDNPNMPTILSSGNIITGGYDVVAYNTNGQIIWKKGIPVVVGFNTPVDKDGNIYFIQTQTKTLYCISPAGQTVWTFTDSRIHEAGYQLSFSPDGSTLYIPCFSGASLLALDIKTRQVQWTFGTLPLLTPPVVDNQGNLYFQKSTPKSITIDTFYCLKPDGTVRWRYIYNKKNAIADLYYGNEPMTIDREGNIYLLAPRDTIVSLTNDGTIRWKKSITAYQGSEQLVCDANGTVYCATLDNSVLAVSNKGSILWSVKLPNNGGWYSSPSLSNGKLIVTGNTDQIYIIE